MPQLLLEGPFESNYSLAIVNRRLAEAVCQSGVPTLLHQRDNTTSFFPSDEFLRDHEYLSHRFVRDVSGVSVDVHSRYIYPPYTDGFRGKLRVVHCYGWEESLFPQRFVQDFNSGLDLVTVMSEFVRDVLRQSGVRVPVSVVGLGADHILSERAKAGNWLDEDAFNFLHVSSCFPRKAPELMVRAFCQEFTGREHVRLIIKTFPNPHNEINQIVSEIAQEFPRHPPIEIISDSLDLGEMRYLYEGADCLVSASRGEGFGLPVAEAMFVGCPVIATLYSGQADICKPEHCWSVDYELRPAQTHLTEGPSIWADPVLDSLRTEMRNVYRATAQERTQKTELAREFVQSNFTWRSVAEKHWSECRRLLRTQEEGNNQVNLVNGSPLSIGFITTWNTKCGIAEYSRYLATALPNGYRITVFANREPETVRPDEDFVTRCWEPGGEPTGSSAAIEDLARLILESGVQAVSIQYNFSFFSPADLNVLVERLKASGIVVAVTMHAINHPNFSRLRPALESADICICHRSADVEAVGRLGVRNVVLQKQGIVASLLDQNRSLVRKSKWTHCFVVSCFGFFLPPKGIYQLIQAFARARAVEPLLRLKLVNSLYPIPESAAYARECIGLVQRMCLGGEIELTTAFLAPEEALQQLADSDLVVLPYLYSTESSSAAGAFAVASLTPVLCSDLPLFEELSGVIHSFPSGDVMALANKILQLAADPLELGRYRTAQAEFVRTLAWPTIARNFGEMLKEHVARGLGRRDGLAETVPSTK